MEETEEKIDISLESARADMMKQALNGRQEALKINDRRSLFVNDRLFSSLMRLSKTERLEETVLKKAVLRVLNMVDGRKLVITEDDFNPKCVASSPTIEELNAKNKEVGEHEKTIEEKLIGNYDEFVMNLLHRDFFKKEKEDITDSEVGA